MTFEKYITDQINCPACAKYANYAGSRNVVLGFIDGNFVELGYYIFEIWDKSLVKADELIQFGIACEEFRTGKRKLQPYWAYGPDGKLRF